MTLPSMQKTITVLLLCLMVVGCDLFGSSSTPAPTAPVPIITGLDQDKNIALGKALKCIVGKKVKFKGTYWTVTGAGISFEREAVIHETLFKVTPDGSDELSKIDSETDKPALEEWWAYYTSASDTETEWSGGIEVYCFDIVYKRGPFNGPGGKCSIIFKAKICEDCLIVSTSWELKCGVDTHGSGGQIKAKGSWSIKE